MDIAITLGIMVHVDVSFEVQFSSQTGCEGALYLCTIKV